MSCFINPVEEDQCVFLTYEGNPSGAEIVDAQSEAHSLLGRKCWNRIVVDITELKSTLTIAELFEIGSGISLTLPQSARVALVTRTEQTGQAKFIESVARNDGVFLTFFSDAEQAIAWVKGTVPHEPVQHRLTDKRP